MGYTLSINSMNKIISEWSKEYIIYAPKVFKDGATFSDVNLIKYAEVNCIEEIEFEEKSHYSFKDILLPISETLFYFTEDSVTEPNPEKRGAIIFLRSCDLHSIKVLDEMYLQNGFEDYYYSRIRNKVKFILIGCKESFENCFCVDMNSNTIDTYDAYLEIKNSTAYIDNKLNEWEQTFEALSSTKEKVTPTFVTETQLKVNIPENINLNIIKSKMWDEYDSRCIACGRCNFVCPTCTCFTMQDIISVDNSKVGERRRVWASCMMDGFTTVAGGDSYREKNGDKMRFRVLHKVYDYKKRTGHHMCTGCGRCDDVCPEYISYTNCINKLESAMVEVDSLES
jgi:anaerobic sulfite reductase subunit A